MTPKPTQQCHVLRSVLQYGCGWCGALPPSQPAAGAPNAFHSFSRSQKTQKVAEAEAVTLCGAPAAARGTPGVRRPVNKAENGRFPDPAKPHNAYERVRTDVVETGVALDTPTRHQRRRQTTSCAPGSCRAPAKPLSGRFGRFQVTKAAVNRWQRLFTSV